MIRTQIRGNSKNSGQNISWLKKGIYEQLLAEPDKVVTGTVKELAEKYEIDVMTMVGFLDGINGSLKEANQSKRWMRIPPSIWDLIKNCCIKTWLMRKLTGCMNSRHGRKSSRKSI